MFQLDTAWPWITLALLGAFHGLNPAMGWLFAVSIGFQERRTSAVMRALGPIALGHAFAIAAVAVPVVILEAVLPPQAMLVVGGLALLAYASYTIANRFRHPRWVGMRVTSLELFAWSALMAAAHGAGLMLVPALAGVSSREPNAAMASTMHSGHAGHMEQMQHAGEAHSLVTPVAAVLLHSLATLLVMGALAVIVYRWIGIGILRRAWINLDVVWTAALLIAGSVTLGAGLLPLVRG